ncbi:MAG TPA: HAD family hydrolase [Methanoregula sp.]|nr:HAD family hydrolase [Methanoregula sp.]HVP95663.1 HAD family hydrolase [Methanoregula sp.]
MTVAVVFDSAGTLLSTYRVAKDVAGQVLMPGVETTTLTFASMERVLIVLPVHSKHIITAPPAMLLSAYLAENKVGFGISCTRKILTADDIGDLLYADKKATVGDLQECIRNVWGVCRGEIMLTLNSGAILNMAQRSVEFTITAGGWPFEGAKEAITALHRMGIPAFIASGDRSTKLEIMADHLGIPRDRVYGVATPSVKAQIVSDLKKEYDHVVMVGDGINDLAAFHAADTAILTVQQAADRPRELFETADHVIHHVRDVLPIIDGLAGSVTSRS